MSEIPVAVILEVMRNAEKYARRVTVIELPDQSRVRCVIVTFSIPSIHYHILVVSWPDRTTQTERAPTLDIADLMHTSRVRIAATGGWISRDIPPDQMVAAVLKDLG